MVYRVEKVTKPAMNSARLVRRYSLVPRSICPLCTVTLMPPLPRHS